MSVTNSFSSGTTIESASVNANFTDIASEITNSLPRDGQASMTGQLKAASGTVAAPGITFGSDTNTGFYRSTGDTISVSCGGTWVGNFDASGLSDSNGAGAVYLAAGTAMLFVQTAAPTGWTKSTDHNDKALRIVSGAASSGGTTAFSSVLTSRTIDQANLPNVNLSAASLTGSSSTTVTVNNDTLVIRSTGAGVASGTSTTNWSTSTISATATTTTTIGGNVPLGGSGTAMDFAIQYVDCIIATRD